MSEYQTAFRAKLERLLDDELDQWGVLERNARLDAKIAIQDALAVECRALYIADSPQGVILEEAIPRLAMKHLSAKWCH
jgi:hypothetical protein